jgi:hypothetical protein
MLRHMISHHFMKHGISTHEYICKVSAVSKWMGILSADDINLFEENQNVTKKTKYSIRYFKEADLNLKYKIKNIYIYMFISCQKS